jgi:hypothetical protein
MRARQKPPLTHRAGFTDGPSAWSATFADPDDNYFQLLSPM